MFNLRFYSAKSTAGINLEKPVHAAYSHWSEFTYLIPDTVIREVRNMPKNVSSLIQPDCSVAAFIAGQMLGNASIYNFGTKHNSRFTLRQAANLRSLSYCAITAMFLEHIDQGNGIIRLYRTQSGSWTLDIQSKRTKLWNEARTFWYPNGVKSIPRNISAFLSNLGIAVWIMSSGGQSGSAATAGTEFYTQSFDKNQLVWIKTAMNHKYKLQLYLAPGKILQNGKHGWRLRGDSYDGQRMRIFFAHLMHESWHYKFPVVNLRLNTEQDM